MVSRRQFLYFSVASPLVLQWPALAGQGEGKKTSGIFPRTIAVLQESFITEMIAYKNYIGYTSKALSEKYQNIAYLFYSFSFSEKVHANNYERVLAKLGWSAKPSQIVIEVRDTKSNLQKAAQNELKKINTTYPDFMRELEAESCEEAIVSCQYSLNSHRQHEKIVKRIDGYSELFFGSVSKKIEGQDFDFHVCMVCGSTINRAPDSPCVICNKPELNYQRIERPV